MTVGTLEEFTSALTRAFSRYRPRVIWDVKENRHTADVRTAEFIISHPDDPRLSVSLHTEEHRGGADNCSLWFGQTEVTARLDPDEAIPAMEEILADRVVAILRYKNENAYDNHRPSGIQWLYQLTEDKDSDAEALDKMLARLHTPATLVDKLGGKMIGIFEVSRWSGIEVIRR